MIEPIDDKFLTVAKDRLNDPTTDFTAAIKYLIDSFDEGVFPFSREVMNRSRPMVRKTRNIVKQFLLKSKSQLNENRAIREHSNEQGKSIDVRSEEIDNDPSLTPQQKLVARESLLSEATSHFDTIEKERKSIKAEARKAEKLLAKLIELEKKRNKIRSRTNGLMWRSLVVDLLIKFLKIGSLALAFVLAIAVDNAFPVVESIITKTTTKWGHYIVLTLFFLIEVLIFDRLFRLLIDSILKLIYKKMIKFGKEAIQVSNEVSIELPEIEAELNELTELVK